MTSVRHAIATALRATTVRHEIATALRPRDDGPVVIARNAVTKQSRGARALLLLALLIPLFAFAAETRDASEFFTLNTGDLRAELADAKAAGKQGLLLVFEQEGCPYCRAMREKVFNRRDVQDYFRSRFVNLSIDIWSAVTMRDFGNRELTEKAFAQATKVRATPTFVFYDLSGKELARYVGATDHAEEFLLLGEFVSTGAYRTRTFARYKTDKSRKGS